MKAQSALEFLTTYGWAFLVILIMIGALNYFGVLDPTGLVPELCNAPAGYVCTGSSLRVTPNTLFVAVEHANANDHVFYGDITLSDGIFGPACGTPTAITVDVEEAGAFDLTSGGPGPTWRTGEEAIFEVTCEQFQSKEVVDAEISIPYQVVGSALIKSLPLTVRAYAPEGT